MTLRKKEGVIPSSRNRLVRLGEPVDTEKTRTIHRAVCYVLGDASEQNLITACSLETSRFRAGFPEAGIPCPICWPRGIICPLKQPRLVVDNTEYYRRVPF